MFTTHFIHLAIEPVTTTVALVALGKIFGAGVAGGTAGSAMVQKLKKNKVNWGRAVGKGLESVDDVSSFLSGVSDTASLIDSSRSDKRN
ncbi:hypothetical protein [Okeania sp. KiyG1]|uniref:hypothetical protein n=1 Tax=Okeania sp. KiyG1 TaxID=2720165 RepID=UPI001921B9B8|nr:hypothetical protein [Okeania sp. KiyG1]GGA37009.1 hypothetical protein CYANOKiyG1_54990 [Okeania sp. KiyG1]